MMYLKSSMSETSPWITRISINYHFAVKYAADECFVYM
jgi:hypothetical protein